MGSWRLTSSSWTDFDVSASSALKQRPYEFEQLSPGSRGLAAGLGVCGRVFGAVVVV